MADTSVRSARGRDDETPTKRSGARRRAVAQPAPKATKGGRGERMQHSDPSQVSVDCNPSWSVPPSSVCARSVGPECATGCFGGGPNLEAGARSSAAQPKPPPPVPLAGPSRGSWRGGRGRSSGGLRRGPRGRSPSRRRRGGSRRRSCRRTRGRNLSASVFECVMCLSALRRGAPAPGVGRLQRRRSPRPPPPCCPHGGGICSCARRGTPRRCTGVLPRWSPAPTPTGARAMRRRSPCARRV